jgi:hypothetical protein
MASTVLGLSQRGWRLGAWAVALAVAALLPPAVSDFRRSSSRRC